MNFNARALQADTSLLRNLGEPVLYAGKTINAMVDESVALVGEFGQVVDHRTEISVLTNDAPALKKGEVITRIQTGAMLTIDGIASTDGNLITAWVRKS